MSAQDTFITVIKAAERSAYDYLPKPFDLRELVSIVGRAMSEPKNRVHAAPNADLEGMPLVGRSPAMQEIYGALARLMQTDLTVMISGESGTGKELVARAAPLLPQRENRPDREAVQMADRDSIGIPRDIGDWTLRLAPCGLFGKAERPLPFAGELS
jgi:two-component system nitrogen regulation response regulator GlnG